MWVLSADLKHEEKFPFESSQLGDIGMKKSWKTKQTGTDSTKSKHEFSPYEDDRACENKRLNIFRTKCAVICSINDVANLTVLIDAAERPGIQRVPNKN